MTLFPILIINDIIELVNDMNKEKILDMISTLIFIVGVILFIVYKNNMLIALTIAGVVGLLFYVSAFIPFVIGIIKLTKQKQYRIAFIHSLCLLAIFGHSISESTLLFTPNIQGMYLTIVFYLPVMRYTKDKYYNELEEDLNKQQISDMVANKEMICQFISAMIMGLIVAFISTFTTSYILTNSGALLAYFIIVGVLLIALFIVPIIVSIRGKKSINISSIV